MFVCILPEKAVPEMIYTVSGGTLNPTHSLTHWLAWSKGRWPPSAYVTFIECTRWTLAVAVRCYNDSTINIVVAVTIISYCWMNTGGKSLKSWLQGRGIGRRRVWLQETHWANEVRVWVYRRGSRSRVVFHQDLQPGPEIPRQQSARLTAGLTHVGICWVNPPKKTTPSLIQF